MVPIAYAAAAIVGSALLTPAWPVSPGTDATVLAIPATCRPDGTMRVRVDLDGSSGHSFVVDTGSNISFVDAEIATALALPSAGRFTSGSGSSPLVSVALALAGITLRKLPIVANQRSRLRGVIEPADAGILGSDVLRALGRVTIDWETCHLWVGEEPSAASWHVPLEWHEGRPVVTAAAGARLLIDSGTSMLIVFDGTRAASTFRRNRGVSSSVRIQRTTGEEIGRVGAVPALRLGTLELSNVPALAVRNWYRDEPGAPEGLLPLRLFSRVYLNCEEGYAVFERAR